ncbi:hypothetical protein HOK68_03725 [Candidatus Woesearchaeota archaeon]|jgi:hypothetical protein|nr:hypothetical protein [Candidatus Woesearchaeota archaeon]MBT4387511.1 hypothetical protein [Candidatus Woesearchaeota archaeon]MBT4595353.1 hypothetical protein [Candidatus Woesearchaeota archaeon]MBT5741242.1 hypothetical protein [Candidatus Woesearchaeota archaeon]MBT6505862.1 hypothetical protein [Candidatus Woesearchaeota archaeon]
MEETGLPLADFDKPTLESIAKIENSQNQFNKKRSDLIQHLSEQFQSLYFSSTYNWKALKKDTIFFAVEEESRLDGLKNFGAEEILGEAKYKFIKDNMYRLKGENRNVSPITIPAYGYFIGLVKQNDLFDEGVKYSNLNLTKSHAALIFMGEGIRVFPIVSARSILTLEKNPDFTTFIKKDTRDDFYYKSSTPDSWPPSSDVFSWDKQFTSDASYIRHSKLVFNDLIKRVVGGNDRVFPNPELVMAHNKRFSIRLEKLECYFKEYLS